MDYGEFLAGKGMPQIAVGIAPDTINPGLFSHQRYGVEWALHKGRAAIFWMTGLGKSRAFLEWADQIARHTGGDVLVIVPLAVAHQTVDEANALGIGTPITIIRDWSEKRSGINVINYDRLQHVDPSAFTAVILDEGSILKSLDGATRTKLVEMFHDTPYRLVATATPSPNDYMEIGSYAEFLGVMTRSEMLATFFTHDGGDTSKWRLKGHARDDFWKWVASWALALRTPADLGFDGSRYALPPLHQHAIEIDGPVQQGMLFAMDAMTIGDQRQIRRDTLAERVQQCVDLVATAPDEQWIVWCELNDESTALAKAIPGAVEVRGSDSAERKESVIRSFQEGQTRILVSKPSMFGFGLNLQMCHRIIFCGVSHSFEQTFQAIKRIHRFGQHNECHVWHVYAESEGRIVRNLARKEAEYHQMMDELIGAIGKFQERGRDGYNAITPMYIPDWLLKNIEEQVV